MIPSITNCNKCPLTNGNSARKPIQPATRTSLFDPAPQFNSTAKSLVRRPTKLLRSRRIGLNSQPRVQGSALVLHGESFVIAPPGRRIEQWLAVRREENS
jgi:hypothetical protein